jgi:anion-transporting  ArsA/GET3 family ATPase
MSLQQLKAKKQKLLLKRDKLNEQIKDVTNQIDAEEIATIRNILKKENMSIEEAEKLLKGKQEESADEYV